MSYIYLGIDPGAQGGLAVIYPEGNVVAHKMPDTEQDIWDWLRNCSPNLPIRAALEQVGGFVAADKGVPGMGSSMFNFGRNYGFLRGCLTVLKSDGELEWTDVTSNVWQRALDLPTRARGESKSSHKNILKARAQALFPHLKVTLATSDALLLAYWCQLKHLKVKNVKPLTPKKVTL